MNERTHTSIASSMFWPVNSSEPQRTNPKQVGPFKVLRVLGEGGMGTVYLARQEHPLVRTVALKLIRGDMDTAAPELLERFTHERQALALMDHENIARVLEAGVTADDQLFFAMQHVDGLPITAYCDKHKLGIPERLALFGDVCRGIQHAHQKQVIHCDIKPSNVLIATTDGHPCPKVIDFGIARMLDTQVARHLQQPRDASPMGTPGYMSVEQTEGDARKLDTRTDVHGLGVLLYELLVGLLPLEVDPRRRHPSEQLRFIRECTPPPPSARYHLLIQNSADELISTHSADTIADRRSCSPQALVRTVTGELDSIVMKAIAKQRDDRYDGVSALSGDIERYLCFEPTTVGPTTWQYRFLKGVRRNRGPVAVAATILLIAAVAFVALVAMYARVVEESRKTAWGDYVYDIARANDALKLQDVVSAEAALEDVSEEYRATWESRYLRNQLDGSLKVLRGHTADVAAVAAGPQGKHLASGSYDGTVRIWDAECLGPAGPPIDVGSRVHALAFSPDGHQLAIGADDSSVHVLALSSRQVITVLRRGDTRGAVRELAFDRTGERLFVAHMGSVSPQGEVAIWRLDSGVREHCWLAHQFATNGMVISHGTDQLITGGEDGVLCVWNVDNTSVPDALLRVETDSKIASIAALMDLGLLATGEKDGRIRLWKHGNGRQHSELRGHSQPVRCIRLSPDGRTLASASADKTIRLWNTVTGEQDACLVGHKKEVMTLAFARDGRYLISGSADGTVRIWDLLAGRPSRPMRVSSKIEAQRDGTSVAFSSDGGTVATTSRDGLLRLWRAADWHELSYPLLRDRNELIGAFFTPTDSDELIVAIRPNTLEWWKRADGSPWHTETVPDPDVTAIALSPDGKFIATAGLNGDVTLTDAKELTAPVELEGHLNRVEALAFSLDATQIVAAYQDGKLRAWAINAPAQAVTWDAHSTVIRDVAYTPDGQTIVSASADASIGLWNQLGESVAEPLRGHGDAVTCVAFTSDGTRLASGSRDNTIKLWDLARKEEVLTLTGHIGAITDLAFSPTNDALISVDSWGAMHVWECERSR